MHMISRYTWYTIRLVQYRPSHKKPEIVLMLTFLLRARPKAHFLMLHLLISVSKKTLFLVLYEVIHSAH